MTECREYEGLEEESGERTGQLSLLGEICQDNKRMLFCCLSRYFDYESKSDACPAFRTTFQMSI